jgi:hypothetical protein
MPRKPPPTRPPGRLINKRQKAAKRRLRHAGRFITFDALQVLLARLQAPAAGVSPALLAASEIRALIRSTPLSTEEQACLDSLLRGSGDERVGPIFRRDLRTMDNG